MPVKHQLMTADSAENATSFITGHINGSLVTDFPMSNDSPFARTLVYATKLEYLGIVDINGVPRFSIRGTYPDNEYANQYHVSGYPTFYVATIYLKGPTLSSPRKRGSIRQNGGLAALLPAAVPLSRE